MYVRTISVLLCVVLAACSSAQSDSNGSAGYPTAIHFNLDASTEALPQIHDERPEEFRVSNIAVLENGAVKVSYGDEVLTPAPASLFQISIGQELGSTLKGRKIVLKRFDIGLLVRDPIVDYSKIASTAASTPHANFLGAALAVPFIAGVERLRGNQNIVSIVIVGTIDDKKFVAYSDAIFRGRVDENDMRRVIHETLVKAAKEIVALGNP